MLGPQTAWGAAGLGLGSARGLAPPSGGDTLWGVRRRLGAAAAGDAAAHRAQRPRALGSRVGSGEPQRGRAGAAAAGETSDSQKSGPRRLPATLGGMGGLVTWKVAKRAGHAPQPRLRRKSPSARAAAGLAPSSEGARARRWEGAPGPGPGPAAEPAGPARSHPGVMRAP